MGRPKLVDGTVPTQIRFKARTLGRLHLLLYSDLAKRVPYGRLSEFVELAVQEKLDNIYQELADGAEPES